MPRRKHMHPFVREGTGLKRPLARQFVERHGGTMAVASGPRLGSTFTITLPDRPQPAGIA